MYRLTERRFAAAEEILEVHRERLEAKHSISCHSFEMELRECWKLGYQEIKDIMNQLIKMPRFRLLAGYYMQFSGSPGVVSEFQNSLAALYGLKWWNDPSQRERVAEFWKHAFDESPTATE